MAVRRTVRPRLALVLLATATLLAPSGARAQAEAPATQPATRPARVVKGPPVTGFSVTGDLKDPVDDLHGMLEPFIAQGRPFGTDQILVLNDDPDFKKLLASKPAKADEKKSEEE